MQVLAYFYIKKKKNFFFNHVLYVIIVFLLNINIIYERTPRVYIIALIKYT